MDDEINEKKRASLEKDFSNFFQGMKDYKEKNKDLDSFKYLAFTFSGVYEVQLLKIRVKNKIVVR